MIREKESNSQNKKENEEASSHGISINSHSKKSPTDEKEKNYKKWFKKLLKCAKKRWVLGWCTFVVAFFVLLGTIGLFYESAQQTIISESTAHKQLRAYIVVVEPKLVPIFTIGKQIEMSYIVRNDGQTPAYNVKSSVHIRILPRANKPEIMPDSTNNFFYPICGSGVPQIRKIHSGDQVLTQKHIDGFNNKEGSEEFRIYFWGKIEYTDIFKKPHWTTFCYEYIFDPKIRGFSTYGTCNDADRD